MTADVKLSVTANVTSLGNANVTSSVTANVTSSLTANVTSSVTANVTLYLLISLISCSSKRDFDAAKLRCNTCYDVTQSVTNEDLNSNGILSGYRVSCV